jgi:hypothetical protein
MARHHGGRASGRRRSGRSRHRRRQETSATPCAAQQANANAPAPEANPGPPPILTRRGANILVRIEKLFDDAASKTVAPPASFIE